jgi:hypothetical protein
MPIWQMLLTREQAVSTSTTTKSGARLSGCGRSGSATGEGIIMLMARTYHARRNSTGVAASETAGVL